MKDLNHICYDITMDTLIENYIQTNYMLDTVLVIHNPGKYVDRLKEIGLYIDDGEIHFDTIMVVMVEGVLDGLEILRLINPHSGPVCSLWVEGQYFTDNIEDKLLSRA
jgi:hypothetical protein